MKLWLAMGFALLFLAGTVSPVFAAAAVEYGIIGSKPGPGSGLGNALNKKFNQLNDKMGQAAPAVSASRPGASSNATGKVRVEGGKPINLVPTNGGALDPETGLFYSDEGGGYYNPETTTFVIRDTSGAKEP